MHVHSTVPEPFPGMAATAAAKAATGEFKDEERMIGEGEGQEAGYLLIEAAGADGNV